MAAPNPAIMPPKEIIQDTVSLPHKPGALIHRSLVQGERSSEPNRVLIVFLNGLASNKTSWINVMAGIVRQRKGTAAGIPSMLAYDRYGQGMTEARDPQDEGAEEGYGHDVADAVDDLHYLIAQFNGNAPQHRLVLVGNSIGCAIARLYAQKHPVAAILFLDSIIANSNFDFFPNPDAADFHDNQLPEDVTIEKLREQRSRFLAIFHPDVINKEGLSRRNLAEHLPHSDRPLLGKDAARPWITVVGHDFDRFAEESLRTMDTPKSLSMLFSNPLWHRYNKGLAKITDPKFSKGPIIARDCGHFIQRDDPNFVVDETLELVDKVRLEGSVNW